MLYNMYINQLINNMNISEFYKQRYNLYKDRGSWNDRGWQSVRLYRKSNPVDYYIVDINWGQGSIAVNFEGGTRTPCNISIERLQAKATEISQHMREVLPTGSFNTKPVVNIRVNALDGAYKFVQFLINEGNRDRYGMPVVDAFLYALYQADLGDIALEIEEYIS